MEPLAGVASLCERCDGFILDQWGVLHDGTRPYPGAVVCLERLRAAGKRVVILSNSGRDEAGNVRLMAQVGFERSLYGRFISAGDHARDAIRGRATPFHASLGRRFYAFTRDDNASLLDGLGLERVASVGDADFLMVIGIDSPRRTVADYEAELAAGAARALPMVCANPDITRVSPDGLVDAPGALARRYEALGGQVYYHGKPHPPIYTACLEALGCPAGRVVAVGDSLEHDIAGALRVGLRSAFVAGGIHLEEMGAAWGSLPERRAWARFLESAEARPDYLLATFAW